MQMKTHGMSRTSEGSVDPTGGPRLIHGVLQNTAGASPIGANTQVDIIRSQRVGGDQCPFDQTMGQTFSQFTITETARLALADIHQQSAHTSQCARGTPACRHRSPRPTMSTQTRCLDLVDDGCGIDLVEGTPRTIVATIAAIDIQRVRVGTLHPFHQPATFLHL